MGGGGIRPRFDLRFVESRHCSRFEGAKGQACEPIRELLVYSMYYTFEECYRSFDESQMPCSITEAFICLDTELVLGKCISQKVCMGMSSAILAQCESIRVRVSKGSVYPELWRHRPNRTCLPPQASKFGVDGQNR